MTAQTPPSDYLIRAQTFTKTTHQDIYPTITPTNTSNTQAGKVIVITGAGKGIGRYGYAASFAHSSPKAIIITARNLPILTEVATEIHAINPNIEVLPLRIDVTDESSITAAWTEVKEKYGHADVLINNAGSLHTGKVGEAKVGEWWGDFETNVKGTFVTTQGFLQLLPPSHPATIITLSSALALAIVPSLSSYSLSKLAILQLSAFITAEYPNVTAVGIHPGIVHTDIVTEELKPFAHDTFELAGGVAVWLATENARFLSGRYVSSNWSVDELLERKEEIVSEGKLLVGIKGSFGADQFE